MDRLTINRCCAIAPVALSVVAFVWVLGNVAGGAHADGGEGLGFKIFWLLIAMQIPFILGYVATADWHKVRSVSGRAALQVAGLILAFAPVAYFHL